MEDNPGSFICCKGLHTNQCPDCLDQYCPTSSHCQSGSFQYPDGSWWDGCSGCAVKRKHKINEGMNSPENYSLPDNISSERIYNLNKNIRKWKKKYENIVKFIQEKCCEDCENKCNNHIR